MSVIDEFKNIFRHNIVNEVKAIWEHTLVHETTRWLGLYGAIYMRVCVFYNDVFHYFGIMVVANIKQRSCIFFCIV